MRAWGTGAFDNDAAGNLLAELRHSEPRGRGRIVTEALQAAADAGDFLGVDEGQTAIAAAAIVAAARHGRPVTDDQSGTNLSTADLPPVTPDLLALAARALDRVIGANSEWRQLWEQTEFFERALTAVAELSIPLA